MIAIETTPPVQRTFNLTEINSKELSVIRQALDEYYERLKEDRESQDDIIASKMKDNDSGMPFHPLRPSEEEELASILLNQIRSVERAGIKRPKLG